MKLEILIICICIPIVNCIYTASGSSWITDEDKDIVNVAKVSYFTPIFGRHVLTVRVTNDNDECAIKSAIVMIYHDELTTDEEKCTMKFVINGKPTNMDFSVFTIGEKIHFTASDDTKNYNARAGSTMMERRYGFSKLVQVGILTGCNDLPGNDHKFKLDIDRYYDVWEISRSYGSQIKKSAIAITCSKNKTATFFNGARRHISDEYMMAMDTNTCHQQKVYIPGESSLENYDIKGDDVRVVMVIISNVVFYEDVENAVLPFATDRCLKKYGSPDLSVARFPAMTYSMGKYVYVSVIAGDEAIINITDYKILKDTTANGRPGKYSLSFPQMANGRPTACVDVISNGNIMEQFCKPNKVYDIDVRTDSIIRLYLKYNLNDRPSGKMSHVLKWKRTEEYPTPSQMTHHPTTSTIHGPSSSDDNDDFAMAMALGICVSVLIGLCVGILYIRGHKETRIRSSRFLIKKEDVA